VTSTAAVVISVKASFLVTVLRINSLAISNYDAMKILVIKAQTNKLLTSDAGYPDPQLSGSAWPFG